MEITSNIITLLQFLLPGFITAWVYYGFTSYTRPSQFEQIVQALIFTIFVQAIVYIIKAVCFFIGSHYAIGQWIDSADVVISVITAILFGIIISFFANSDNLHHIFRLCKITRQTSYASEWYSTFHNQITYIVLHLKDERRLLGWPHEWPSDPTKGHFVMRDVSWLTPDQEIHLFNIENFIIDVNEVKWVEFLNNQKEERNECKTSKSGTAFEGGTLDGGNEQRD